MTAPAPDLAATFAGARVLVTGGLGFIGSNLALRLAALGAETVVIDNLDDGGGANRFNLAPAGDRIAIEIGDIRDEKKIAALLPGRDILFNLAGLTSHVDSMKDPVKDLEINALAQVKLLEACRKQTPALRIVHASTRQFYGKAEYLPVDEKHRLRPPDVNGVDKMAGEAFHLMYHDVYGIETIALRLTNTYGPRMRIRDARQMFLGVWVRSVLEDRPFELWGGEQKRDLCYVDDAVEAFLLAAATPGIAGRAFNIGGPAVSLRELAEKLIAAHGGGRFAQHEFPPERRRIDIGDYVADDRAFRAATGWRPRVSIEDGLKRTLEYYRANRAQYI